MRRPRLIAKTEHSITYLADTIEDAAAEKATYDHVCEVFGVDRLEVTEQHATVTFGKPRPEGSPLRLVARDHVSIETS